MRMSGHKSAPGPLRGMMLFLGLALSPVLSMIGGRSESADANSAVFKPTNSSPIVMSADERLVWAVNPADDSVSVIRTDTNTVVTKIAVGDEPQSIALAPNNDFAYVANAAAGTVTVIRIKNPDPSAFEAVPESELTAGSEPWSIVASPDGRRIFVANSGQDTVTVIDANKRRIIGHVDLRDSLPNDPDRNRHFQPRGLAVTQDNTKLYVARFLSFTREGGRQGDDNGGKWTISTKDFTSPPAGSEIFTETSPAALFGNPVNVQYLDRFLRDIGTFNLGVPGQGNEIGNNTGAQEKANPALVAGVLVFPDALGRDYNGDGAGDGFNVSSLLGIHALPPYLHNGACETLECVLSDVNHRTANGTLPDRLANPELQALVVKFLESIDAKSQPFE